MLERPAAVVTGASTGIGYAIAQTLVEQGFHVFPTVRKPADAERLQAALGAQATPLIMDVRDPKAIDAASALVASKLGHRKLAGLVNNAGVAVAGPLLYLPPEEITYQMDVNLVAPVRVTQAFAPLLGVDRARDGKPGRIVNISSVGGKLAYPFMGAYIASKHALEGLSASLRQELLLFGIDVIVIEPGAVVTPIFDKAEQNDYSAFQSTEYAPIIEKFSKYFIDMGRRGLPPQAIGRAVHRALTLDKPRTRYTVVANPIADWFLPRLLPDRLLDRMIGRQTGLLPS